MLVVQYSLIIDHISNVFSIKYEKLKEIQS